MVGAAETRAIEELKQVIRVQNVDERLDAFTKWGVRWLLQLQGNLTADRELQAMSSDARASTRRDAIDGMAKVIVRDWLDTAVEVQQIDDRSERLVLTILKGRPYLGDAPDAVVIPLRPKP